MFNPTLKTPQFSHKMEVLQVKECIDLVSEFFKDNSKTELWFNTPNPMLGDVRPYDMIILGRTARLLKFIREQLC